MEGPEISMLQQQRRLKEDYEKIAKCEGWKLLTKRQQGIIRHGLYVQARSERQRFPGTTDDFAYVKSEKHVHDWWCHSATGVLEVEGGNLRGDPGARPADFFTAQYLIPKSKSELVRHIETVGFPAVVHIVPPNENPNEKPLPSVHSFIALGHDEQEGMVIWEKMTADEPYRIGTLDNAINFEGTNHLNYFWGVRKLKSVE